jgi:hypothetical protein
MKEYDFLPEIEGLILKGSVKIKPLGYLERLEAVKTLNLKTQSDGSVELDAGLEAAQKLYALAKKQVISVNLELDSGCKLDSFDSLEYSDEGAKVLQEIGKTLIKGIKLGKS